MSYVSTSRRLFESCLKKDNTPVFSQNIIRDAQSRAQKLPHSMMLAQSSRSMVKPASSTKPCKNTSSLNGMMLWNSTKSVKIPKVDNIMETNHVTPDNLNDVTTADLNDVMTLQIPKVWQITPAQLTIQISQRKLVLLAQRIKDLIKTLGMQPHPCSSFILAMMVDKLSKAQRNAAFLQCTLEAEESLQTKSSQQLQKHTDELESSLEDQKQQAKTFQGTLQRQIDELESSLEDERRAGRQAQELQSHLTKLIKSSGTQTKSWISVPSSSSSQEVDRSEASSEEIFYDALSTIDQSDVSSEEIFHDAVSNTNNVTFCSACSVVRDFIDRSPVSSEEYMYDALSTSDVTSNELTYHSASSVARDFSDQSTGSSEEIFYNALSTIPKRPPHYLSDDLEMKDYEKASTSFESLGPVDSLDKAIILINSELDGTEKATRKSKGKAVVGTIVRSKDDLVPFREPNKIIKLGSGAAGTVYLHRHTKTKEPVALKVVHIPLKEGDRHGRRKAALMKLKNEVRILKRLGCMEWFPEFYGCCRVGKDVIGISMEFFGDVEKGESYSILNCMDGTGPKLDRDSWMNVMLDVADGLTVMHKKGYLCNDLKEDNVLLVKSEGEWRAKIIDFGWSSDIHTSSVMPFSARQKRAYKYHQMYNYIAPECALKKQPLSVSSDVYSLGRLAAFLGQEMPSLKKLGDYGIRVYSCQPRNRPSLQRFSQEITYLRCRTDESDSVEDSFSVTKG